MPRPGTFIRGVRLRLDPQKGVTGRRTGPADSAGAQVRMEGRDFICGYIVQQLPAMTPARARVADPMPLAGVHRGGPVVLCPPITTCPACRVRRGLFVCVFTGARKRKGPLCGGARCVPWGEQVQAIRATAARDSLGIYPWSRQRSAPFRRTFSEPPAPFAAYRPSSISPTVNRPVGKPRRFPCRPLSPEGTERSYPAAGTVNRACAFGQTGCYIV